MPLPEINYKQRRFVEEYFIDLNATQACIRAGYAPKCADKIGSELLRNTRVQAYINKRKKELEVRTRITTERVLREYEKLAFSNMKNYAEWDGASVTLISSDKLTRAQAAAISEITETTVTTPKSSNTTVKIKLHDKKGSLDSLAKWLGMMIEKHEHTGKDGKPLHAQPIQLIDPEKLKNLNAEQLAALEAVFTEQAANQYNRIKSDKS